MYLPVTNDIPGDSIREYVQLRLIVKGSVACVDVLHCTVLD